MRAFRTVNGMKYLLDAPWTLFNRPRPLIVVLHGGGGGPEQVEWQSNMASAIRQENFIAAYPTGVPYGVGHFWNASPNPKSKAIAEANHVIQLDRVVQDIRQDYKISQVYACGISNGAHMAYKWASESYYASAIGTVAGQRAVGQYTKTPTRAIPLIHFHGRLDTFNPIEGGLSNPAESAFEQYEILSLEKCLESWYNQNKPFTNALSYYKSGVLSVTQCGLNPVRKIILEKGGHTWPGGNVSQFEKKYGVGELIDYPASTTMLKFFKEL